LALGGALLFLTMIAAPAQAYTLNMTGTMTITQVGTSVTISQTATTNTTTCWGMGDTFTFGDTELTDNTMGSQQITGAYKIELYEWVNGKLGNLIDGPYFANHINVQPSQSGGSTLSVTGTYNGWNGAPPQSCQVSFHVYRHWGVDNPNNAWSDWY